MALDPPEPVVMILNILGLPWPGVNEDQLHDWARSVREFSAGLCDNSSQVNQTMLDLADTSQSAVITSAADFWETHHQLLLDLRGPLDTFAEALDLAGYEVVAQKWAVIGAAGAITAEFTITQIGAFFTFGADEAALPAEFALTREAVKKILERLTNALIGGGLQWALQEIADKVNRTLGSILNTAFEVHMEVHSLRILYQTLRDMVTRIRGIIAAIEEIAAHAHGQSENSDLADSSGGGGWSGIIRVLEAGVKDFFRDLFKNLPGMLVQGLEALTLGLLRFADRAEAADSGGPSSAPSGATARTAAEAGQAPEPGAVPAPIPESAASSAANAARLHNQLSEEAERLPGIRSAEDFFDTPSVLRGGVLPEQVRPFFEGREGWRQGSLGRGDHAGSGWVVREYTARGDETGRMLRWHPGGGHHGPGPYWRVVGRNGDLGGIIR